MATVFAVPAHLSGGPHRPRAEAAAQITASAQLESQLL